MASHGAVVRIVGQARQTLGQARQTYSDWQQGDDSNKLVLLLLLLMNFVCLMLNAVCCVRAARASKKKSADQDSKTKTKNIWVSTSAQNRYHSNDSCHYVKRSVTMRRLELCAECAKWELDKHE